MERKLENLDGGELLDLDVSLVVDADEKVDQLIAERPLLKRGREVLAAIFNQSQVEIRKLMDFEMSEKLRAKLPKREVILSEKLGEDMKAVCEYYRELSVVMQRVVEYVQERPLEDPLSVEMVELFIELLEKMTEAKEVADAIQSEKTPENWHREILMKEKRSLKLAESDMNYILTKKIIEKGADEELLYNALVRMLLAAKVNLYGLNESVAGQNGWIASRSSDLDRIVKKFQEIGVGGEQKMEGDYTVRFDPNGLKSLLVIYNKALRMYEPIYELYYFFSELIAGSSRS